MPAPTVPVELQQPRGPLGRAEALSGALLRRRGAVLGLSLTALVGIALADLATGYELPLSLLYAVPVVASTWAFGLRAGLALSALSMAAWMITDVLAEHRYSLAVYRYWEGFIRLATFLAFAIVVDQLKRALARSDERLLKVLEGQDAAVCVLDPEAGSLLYRNRSFDAHFPGAARDAAVERLLESALSPSPAGDPEELAFGERWLLVRARWLRWTDERAVLLVSATDVTASREQHARLQATARLVTVGEIASSLAHELNQPLAAISSYVQGCLRRLRGGGADARELVNALAQAVEQAERAGSIIRRVRDFVRSRPPVLAELDLNALVRRAVSAAAGEAGGDDVVELRLASALPLASADAVMLEQVILNLLRNAREAARAAGLSAAGVEIATQRAHEDMLQVTVADRGPGVVGDVAARLFEPFFSGKCEGLGLGLNICRSIVEFHGGRLWMTPRPGGGAQFHFTVRALPAPSP